MIQSVHLYALIMPAFQPGSAAVDLAETLCRRSGCMLIVVNDGSSSGYQKVFEQLAAIENCTVLEHPTNCGKGRALKSAFSYLLENYPDLAGAVTADCDGQHTATDILACLDSLRKNPEKLTVGVRDFTLKRIPWRNRWGNRISCWLFRRCFGIDLPDTQTGLRGIPAAFMQILLEKPGERFEFESIMLLESCNKNNPQTFPLLPLPVQTLYPGNGKSCFCSIKDSLQILRVLLTHLTAVKK